MKLTGAIYALLSLAAFYGISTQAQRYVGGDISLLPDYEDAGAKYKDHDGKPIADLMPWLKEEGMNAMRVRLFVNPEKYRERHQNDTDNSTRYDPNACQDLEYIIPLCKNIIGNGMDLMLDFHYSDTWADPAKQWTPIEWEGLSDEELYAKIHDYTKETLETLRENGITPKFIQPGNEISYGMLWGPLGSPDLKKTFMGNDANWDRLGKLLTQAIKACREVCPDAEILLHTERVTQTDVQKNFYDRMESMNIDYDIIGLSYYPYFHGDMSVLDNALASLQTNYPDKKIMILETGYSYKWEVPGTSHDLSGTWQYSDAGQNKFATDLVSTLEKYDNVKGLFWWWMEYNAFGTSLSGWYNAPLFDSTTGCATSALKTICSFAKSSGITEAAESDSDIRQTEWYDINGRRVPYPVGSATPGLYISQCRKILVR